MGNWFEEQIRLRQEKDDEGFEEACARLRAAITRGHGAAAHGGQAGLRNALDAILGFYGFKPREIPDSIQDLNGQIEYACHPYGIMCREVRLEKGWYRDASGPMLGYWKDGPAAALLPGKLGGYTVFDEKKNKQVRVTGKTAELLGEDAVCFYKPFPRKEMGVRDLGKFALGCIAPSTVALIAVMALAVSLIGMLSPKLTKLLFSTVIAEGSLRLLLSIMTFSLSVTVSTLLVGAFKSLLTQRLNTQIGMSVQAAAMARLLSLPAGFFRQYSAGELTERTQYLQTLCSTVVSVFLSSGLTSLCSLIYLAQVFTYARSLVIPAILITLTTVAFTVATSLAQMKVSRRTMELNAKQSGMTYAMISGVQKLKLSGSEKRAFSRWLRLYAEKARLTWAPPRFLQLSGVISMAISLAGTIVMYYLAVRSGVSVADYNAFNAAYGMVSGAFAQAAGIALTAANLKPILEMVRPILEAAPEAAEDRKMVTRLSGNIQLEHLWFRYGEHAPYVTRDLSLNIRAGQYVAIVGRTGCGKSTLIRLLLGFETPEKGAVYYDGQDLSTLDLPSVRKNIGCVMQNGKLFQGDIYSNIVISAPWLTMDDAWRAAELAGIADDIRAMPMGMHTIIAEGAGGISGGQKQRLMIARALAPGPNILMLDEATSALDNITQKQVSEALDGLRCTRLVIAHRLSTIRQCDRIIVLDGGQIVEDGTYDELIARKGFFAELVERQMLEQPTKGGV